MQEIRAECPDCGCNFTVRTMSSTVKSPVQWRPCPKCQRISEAAVAGTRGNETERRW